MFCEDESQPTLINCMFQANSAEGIGGAMQIHNKTKVILANCLFSGNSARDVGGAIYNENKSHVSLTNCAFVSNTSSGIAGCIFNKEDSSSRLTNCILWGNTDAKNDLESAQIQCGTIIVNNCCIQTWTGRLGGTANFGLNPLFIDPDGPDNKIGTADDNLRLDLAFPCCNAGDNSALPADTADLDKDGDVNEPIPFDIEGKPCILNGIVDLGAYEGN